ncbi:MAG TPA: bifunctional DNA-formamidopyrimidine glycosylase/DNA-(apurinic or apyrimidinic site) lyase [Gammaproteobacteria bacterium]
MPELPEVETTRRGILPLVGGRRVLRVVVRQPRLRWPVPAELTRELPGRTLEAVERRAKYLLLRTGGGTLLLHLGMSGSLRVLDAGVPPGPHDHVDLVLDDGSCLRLRDPRRFGALLWTRADPLHHPLLRDLGPEPFDAAFDGAYLHRLARGRRAAVKPFLMDGRVVVGVGNIYASESLHRAGIDPRRAAGRVGLARYRRLADAVRAVLDAAIAAGGTTLRDFSDGHGQPGYFRIRLAVYDRAGQPCGNCGGTVASVVLGQRASYFCPRCQR